MTYTEMLAAVILETNRPDMAAEIELHIQRATLKLHGLEYWKFDRTAVPLTIATPAYRMTVNTATALTRFRNIWFIKASDASITDPFERLSNTYTGLPFYEPIDADHLMDQHGRNIPNVYYTMGRVINIRSTVLPNQLYVGYYQRPVISPVGSYSSWIADEYPFAIIDEAIFSVFKSIGMEEKVKSYGLRVAEHIQILKTNYLEEQAR